MGRTKIKNNTDPTPTNLKKTAVANLAQMVAEKLSFRPGDSMYDVVKKLGGRISYVDDWDPLEGESLIIEDDGKFVINIPRFTSPLRDRFTIAHELGHYILHSMFGEKPMVFNRKKKTDKLEWEANWFAASFLMPQDKFMEEMRRDQDDLHLASVFDVSVSAIQTRKQTINEY